MRDNPIVFGFLDVGETRHLSLPCNHSTRKTTSCSGRHPILLPLTQCSPAATFPADLRTQTEIPEQHHVIHRILSELPCRRCPRRQTRGPQTTLTHCTPATFVSRHAVLLVVAVKPLTNYQHVLQVRSNACTCFTCATCARSARCTVSFVSFFSLGNHVIFSVGDTVDPVRLHLPLVSVITLVTPTSWVPSLR